MTAFDSAFAALATDPAHATTASNNLVRWLEDEQLATYRPLLLALVEQEAWDLLFDSFYRVLPFGTGGRRGPVGVGPNRMNRWTLGTSVQGNIEFLRERFGADAALSVVIASDVRVFRDLRRAFPKGVPNPLLEMTSVDLARQAACIYAANGVDVHMLDPDGGGFLATPELSFLIRRLGAAGGLNVSASHNHPDDNGGKFYTEQGAQEIPPHDEAMVRHVERVQSVRSMGWDEALAQGRIRFLDPAHHEDYLAEAATVLRGTDRSARVVYTNLHGVGDLAAGDALERAGFELHYVPEQRAHDGTFPGVRFRAPNPEYVSAFGPAISVANRVGADLILASDPDADRIGMMIPDASEDDGWRFVTGHELAALVAAARFEGAEPGCIGIKTEVTTDLFRRVVEAAGGRCIGHLLVGCKYIAEVMRELETKGCYGALEGTLEQVLIGTEESHGFLLTPNIRDKDCAAPALVLAELASRRKTAGSSMLEALYDLYRQHGAVANVQIPLVMTGAVGRKNILDIQDRLRADPPTSIAGLAVSAFHDRRDENGVFGPIVSGTDFASRDLLAFELGPDARLVIRPSGTEPKTKIYAEAVLPVGDDVAAALLAARERAEELAIDFVRQALQRIGMAAPEVGLRCSPLLGIDERIAFGDTIFPALLAAATQGAQPDTLRARLESSTAGWGDGVGLTAPAWAWWRANHELAAGPRAALDAAWA